MICYLLEETQCLLKIIKTYKRQKKKTVKLASQTKTVLEVKSVILKRNNVVSQLILPNLIKTSMERHVRLTKTVLEAKFVI